MSKLSPAVKAVINSPHARSGTVPAPANIVSVYASIASEAGSRNVGLKAWFSAAVSLSRYTLFGTLLLVSLFVVSSNAWFADSSNNDYEFAGIISSITSFCNGVQVSRGEDLLCRTHS